MFSKKIRWCLTTPTASYVAKNWLTTYSSHCPLRKKLWTRLIRWSPRRKNKVFEEQLSGNIGNMTNECPNFNASKLSINYFIIYIYFYILHLNECTIDILVQVLINILCTYNVLIGVTTLHNTSVPIFLSLV